MSTNDPSTARIQIEASPNPSVPVWFGEVALVAHTLTLLGLLTTISNERSRLQRSILYGLSTSSGEFGQDIVEQGGGERVMPPPTACPTMS